MAWLGHPLTVAAVAVLLLNDHVFKALWPGVVTGKLSDFAGLVVAPPLLNLLVGRPRVAIVLTGAVFTLVKTTAVGAALASQAWTFVWGPSQVLADPTDLVALPCLYAAWWVWNHPDPGAVRLVRALTVVPVTVLAVAATGQYRYSPPGAYAVEVRGVMIVVAVRDGGPSSDGTPTGQASVNGGRSWFHHDPEIPPAARSLACLGNRCYRTVPGRLKVEEYGNDRWTTSWEISPGDQDRLWRAYPPDLPEDAEVVESLGIAVQPVAGGHVVVVANGADGIAVRDVYGVWRRLGWGPLGFDEKSAVSLTAPGRYDASVTTRALLVALAAGLAALAAGLRRLDFTAAALALWAGFWLLVTDTQYRPIFLVLGFYLVGASLTVMIVCAVRNRARPQALAMGVATGPAVYFALMAPYHVWGAGGLSHYWHADVLAGVLGVVACVTGVLLTARAADIIRTSVDRAVPPGHFTLSTESYTFGEVTRPGG
ncbi:hypothetical protein Aph01nite_25380 [Acrocarpospora phusangensis]|uniref:Uncharacterized protein n=1 Tax=Acrocarpospora phusangensis TaxID=1070424 RepID=A0A919UNE1_9ACTN|nr:hypothetical protein Aph01nite_25380 [Acrocarpospora phusangensis]